MSSIIGVLAVIVFARSFEINMDWRQGWVDQSGDRQREIVRTMSHATDIPALVDRYVLDFTWSADQQFKTPVVRGIESFRAVGASLYGPQK